MPKLLSKTFKRAKCTVHDLTVEPSHTYNVEGLAVHNSGAGSLVNYVLGITHVDPLRYNLLFARFMSRARKESPDVDSDVSDNDLLKQLLRKEFGDANVVPVSNFNTLALKSLVKDISRFYSVPFEEVNAATKGVEAEVKRATLKAGDDKNVFVLRYEDALKYSPKFKAFIERHPQVGEHIAVLFEQNKSIGRHAGGVVIGDEIHKRMPVIRVRGEKQTSWPEGLHFRMLESCAGLLKYDLLGLKTLRIIQRCIELIIMRDRRDNWIVLELDGQRHHTAASTSVVTRNRGMITAGEVTVDDDVTEVTGVWREQ
jgi:DNA polymerase-3 subunit alpha